MKLSYLCLALAFFTRSAFAQNTTLKALVIYKVGEETGIFGAGVIIFPLIKDTLKAGSARFVYQ